MARAANSAGPLCTVHASCSCSLQINVYEMMITTSFLHVHSLSSYSYFFNLVLVFTFFLELDAFIRQQKYQLSLIANLLVVSLWILLYSNSNPNGCVNQLFIMDVGLSFINYLNFMPCHGRVWPMDVAAFKVQTPTGLSRLNFKSLTYFLRLRS